jgi:hypothetical protein
MLFQTTKKSLLDKDEKLKQKISLNIPLGHLGKSFIFIKSRCKLILYSRDQSVGYYDVSLSLKDRQVKEFMDALCEFLDRYWQNEKFNYRLRDSRKDLDRAFLPQDKTSKEWFANMSSFKKGMAKLAPDLQKKIETGKGCLVSELPKSMQQNILNVLEAHNQMRYDEGAKEPAVNTSLRDATIAFTKHRERQEGIKQYNFIFENEDTISNYGYNAYQDQLDWAKENPTKAGIFPLESYKESDGKKGNASDFPVLQKKISLRLKKVMMSEVLQYLARYHGIEYLSNAGVEKYGYIRRDIEMKDTPIRDVLDNLCEIYDAKWSCRGTGILIFRIKPEMPKMSPEEMRKEMEEAEARAEAEAKLPPPFPLPPI